MEYSGGIGKVIYRRNRVEGYEGEMGKVRKKKGVFGWDRGVEKVVYVG